MNARLSLFLTVAALGAVVAPASAQEPVQLPREPSCRECTIDIRRIALLGQAEGPGIIESENTMAAADGRGRYFLFEVFSPRVKVFDSSNRFLGLLGREGRGPSEFRGVSAIHVVAGDTIHVIDGDNLTHSVFSPSLRFLDSTPLGIRPGIDVAMLDTRRLLVANSIPSAERIGLPLHLLKPDGTIAHSFGSESGAYRPDIPYFGNRAVAPAGPGRVWSAHRNQYRIELWSTEGRKVAEYRRSVDWFPPLLTNGRWPSADVPPPPTLRDVRQDSEGRLWVLIGVPDPKWRRAAAEGGPHGLVVTNEHHYRDTMIEVIDPRTGRLLASTRFPYSAGFIADDKLGAMVMGMDDVPYFAVWQVQLLTRR